MKKILLLLVTIAMLTPIHAQQPQRKRVAVVLSGGGAKGMAHIGALKVIERAGIPVDIITGTSMGSIVGGLYAIGYNAHELDSLVRAQDWAFLLSDKVDVSHQSLRDRRLQDTYMWEHSFSWYKGADVNGGGMLAGKNLMSLFAKLTNGYRDSMDFNKLPIPFACVATNIIDNTEYDFHSGVLAEAMRTSMSIPGAFAPVRKGDMLLVDGGLRNNYPVDIARQMGADIVIGITVQGPPKTADDLKTSAAVIGQIVDVNCKNKYEENMKNTDVLIRADTRGYSTASFTPQAMDTLMHRGEVEAMKHWQELMDLKRSLGLAEDYQPSRVRHVVQNVVPQKMAVGTISFEDMQPNDVQFIRRKYHLNSLDSITVDKMDAIVASMRVDLFYRDADVYYNPNGEKYDIRVVAKGKNSSSLRLGVRFDTEEMVAMQANADMLFNTKIPLRTNLTLRLGKRIMAKGELAFTPVTFNRMTFSLTYNHDDINVYNRGDRAYNVTYNEYKVHLNLVDFNIRNFNVTMGMRFDYYNFQDVLADNREDVEASTFNNGHFLSYHAAVDYNSEDDWNFPTRGSALHGGYAYYTDDFTRYKDDKGFSIVSAVWRTNLTFAKRFTLQPMIFGRLLFGSHIPSIMHNYIGGYWFDHYREGQMLFPGVGYVEHTDRHFIATNLRFQAHITTNNYIIASVAGAQHAEKLDDLLEHGPMMGYLVGYFYNTILGPVGATLGYSSKTREVNFYLNIGFEF